MTGLSVGNLSPLAQEAAWERLAAEWALAIIRIRTPSLWGSPPPSEAQLTHAIALLRDEASKLHPTLTSGRMARLSKAHLLARLSEDYR